MRKIVLLLSLFLSLLVSTGFSDNDRSFTIDQADIQAHVQADGTIRVHELYSYTFNGSFQGTTRAIKSNVQNFKAFLVEEPTENVTMDTDGLEPLNVEMDEDIYKIYTASENETKQVLYSYDVVESVTKYEDVASLNYAFFDSSNETDIQNVSISLYTPAEKITEDTYFFLHTMDHPEVEQSDAGIHYKYNVVSANSSAYEFRLIFPADQLTERAVDVNKERLSTILTTEQLLQDRYDNLEKNLNQFVPLLLVLIITTVVVGGGVLWRHPNRYKGSKGEIELVRLLEQTDPLFMKYVAYGGKLVHEDFIAGLFSLHRRGLISISELPSEPERKSRTPFRFTWVGSEENLSESDQFLKSWLFTEEDEHGQFFLLESLETPENYSELPSEDQKVYTDKFERFRVNFEKWNYHVEKQPDYEQLQSNYKPFQLVSFLLIFATGMMVTYFFTRDILPMAAQYVVPSILTFIAVAALSFKSNKILLSMYYVAALCMCLFLTFTTGTLLLIIFVLVAAATALAIPRNKWHEDIIELRHAVKKAKSLFADGKYPIGQSAEDAERKIQYAILLGYGKMFAEKYGLVAENYGAMENYPLLRHPVQAATAFDPGILLITSSSVAIGTGASNGGYSGGGGSSPGGGGGAGAF